MNTNNKAIQSIATKSRSGFFRLSADASDGTHCYRFPAELMHNGTSASSQVPKGSLLLPQ